MASASPPPPRRRLPQPDSVMRATRRSIATPIETVISSKHSMAIVEREPSASHSALGPMSTLDQSSKQSNQKRMLSRSLQSSTGLPPDQTLSQTPADKNEQSVARKPKRFAPQLIETTRRSRKGSDKIRALQPTDKTDLSPGDNVHLPRHLRLSLRSQSPIVPKETKSDTYLDHVAETSNSPYSSATLSRKIPRQPSFRVPHLPSIQSHTESEESNGSTCPSLSTSPSAASDEAEHYKHASRVRESCDDRFFGYMLAVEARAAEKRLREQAMAAYPNETVHEPVNHFAVDHESEDSGDEMGVGLLGRKLDEEQTVVRRQSVAGWQSSDIPQHKISLQRQKLWRAGSEKLGSRWRLPYTQSSGNLGESTRNNDIVADEAANVSTDPGGNRQKGVGLACMRNAASPPMLGHDLHFHVCLSPRHTKFDATQRPDFGASESATSRQHSGLWTPVDAPSRQGSNTGLWNGVCVALDQNVLSIPHILPTGLMTPHLERGDPFAKSSTDEQEKDPAHFEDLGHFETVGIDSILSEEHKIEAEFNDGFVTQIYNYLSLGYPSLARRYDVELSKITRVPLDEIRCDDQRANTKGYIGAPEGSGCNLSAVKDGRCGRWNTLRLYIREWARQQSGMVDCDNEVNSSWGVRARRGSWAI
ncbi:hypothetical protein MMC19_004424 [Ptychographa xylographoides]|nr:hypothetical protein [Ptychographa xylographoides]